MTDHTQVPSSCSCEQNDVSHIQAREALAEAIEHGYDLYSGTLSDIAALIASLDAEIAALKAEREWRGMDSAPDGEHVLYYFPRGEKGAPAMESLTMYRDDDGSMTFWSHGGPNSGGDYDCRYPPTMWLPLPKPPEEA